MRKPAKYAHFKSTISKKRRQARNIMGKLGRKVVALIALFLGLRLVWISLGSMVSGNGSDVKADTVADHVNRSTTFRHSASDTGTKVNVFIQTLKHSGVGEIQTKPESQKAPVKANEYTTTSFENFKRKAEELFDRFPQIPKPEYAKSVSVPEESNDLLENEVVNEPVAISEMDIKKIGRNFKQNFDDINNQLESNVQSEEKISKLTATKSTGGNDLKKPDDNTLEINTGSEQKIDQYQNTVKGAIEIDSSKVEGHFKPTPDDSHIMSGEENKVKIMAENTITTNHAKEESDTTTHTLTVNDTVLDGDKISGSKDADFKSESLIPNIVKDITTHIQGGNDSIVNKNDNANATAHDKFETVANVTDSTIQKNFESLQPKETLLSEKKLERNETIDKGADTLDKNTVTAKSISGELDAASVALKTENKPSEITNIPGDETPSKPKAIDKVTFDNNRNIASSGHCTPIYPWGQSYHAQISTFGLAEKGNYSVNSDGYYPLPVKSDKEFQEGQQSKPITVILVPFSHADPGYGLTIEQYYKEKSHKTLDIMIDKLTKYPNMTFQWAESVFLERWFRDLSADGKEKVKELIRREQLEIVLGGWVMPDEASTHYGTVVDQLIEGHQWLIENLGVKPETAWINDPFGYSTTMPYLWKSTGMNNMVILRINQAVKALLMKMKAMEFQWRPYWKRSNSSDILTSMMAYRNYYFDQACSPYQKVCEEFEFLRITDRMTKAVRVTEDNVEKQAYTLYKEFRRTADLYKYNTLYMGLGEDFSYYRDFDWENIYTNYQKLNAYINSKPEWNMSIKFGTLSEYFRLIREKEQTAIQEQATTPMETRGFPTLSGDFFPYTEYRNEYWTGYFTTRPVNKKFSRELGSLIKAAEIFNVQVFAIFMYYNVEFRAYKEVAENLRLARRELGMFLHHDGITGTSLPHVVRDYEERLFNAYQSAQIAIKVVLSALLTKGTEQNPNLLREDLVKHHPRLMTRQLIHDVTKGAKLVLVNPLERRRQELVSVYVTSSGFRLESPFDSHVSYQETHPWTLKEARRILITFAVDLPAFGVQVFTFVPHDKPVHTLTVQEEEMKVPVANRKIQISNAFMKAEFDSKSGMLERIIDSEGRVTNVSIRFLLYKSVNSGAYIFGPEGDAQLFSTGKVTVTVSNGNLVSEVKVTTPGISHSVKIYNINSSQGHAIHIRNEIDMAAVGMKNSELVMRLITSVKNGKHFYTDQNGYQLMGRQRDMNRKIEANYYPVTTMAVLEDEHKRLTLHCGQPHGAASLREGDLEVMLDRHMYRDDGRGLGQGVYDNVQVNSHFMLQIEHKLSPKHTEELRYTYPTEDSSLINGFLQNKVLKYSLIGNQVKTSTQVSPIKDKEFPCDVSITGLRNLVRNDLSYNGTSLVLHRAAFQCGFTKLNKQCSDKDDTLTVRSLLPKVKARIKETSLSHLYVRKELGLDSDVRPEPMELRTFLLHV